MDSEVFTGHAPLRADARPPIKAVTLLLPVWGYRFVSQFLEFCLPTLLSSGNIPAVAALLPTRFVVLSRENDEDLIRSHPTWRALERICLAEVAFIDDLITEGNHTATITLAFERAVREAGEAMTDTGFVFLMSDYLFGDGALRSVAERFLDGASGIVAGNFQIIAEEAAPALQGGVDPVSRSLRLPIRELLAWSLGYLHPATAANIINVGLSHNFHTNRLLWRVDENTLIGRFYLIHPIGVRPEVTDFLIGSSLDYSFIPEMCPSGNVVTFTDSDEYFVVEMQPRRHERENLRPGAIKERELAVSLAEWTTAQHRANVAQTIVYHTGDIPPYLADTVAEADAFVARVARLLAPIPPAPFRHHPYWTGSIASNRVHTGQALNRTDWAFLFGDTATAGSLRQRVRALRRCFLGAPPVVTRFHTRWPDYGLPRKALEQVAASTGKVLLLAEDPSLFALWLSAETTVGDFFTLNWSRLRDAEPSRRFGKMPSWYLPHVDSFDACLMVVTEGMLEDAARVLERVGHLLKRHGEVWLVILNDRPYHNAAAFSSIFARDTGAMIDLSRWSAEAHFVPSTRLRWLVYRASDRALRRARDAFRRKQPMLAVTAAEVGLLGIATYLVNLRARPMRVVPEQALWSSVFLTLRRVRRDLDERFVSDAFTFRLRNGTAKPVLTLSPPLEAVEAPTAELPAEPADNGSADLKAAHELAAKLLAGRHDIAIYGFRDADREQISLYDVLHMELYDPYPDLLHRRHGSIKQPLLSYVQFHDILGGALPRRADAIVSLRALTDISLKDEDAFMDNLRGSLSRRQDILILGCPCRARTAGRALPGGGLTTVPENTPQSPGWGTGDVNASLRRTAREGLFSPLPYYRTGAQLKALAHRFFDCVLSFSVVNGVLQPGLLVEADYAVVICSSKKE